MSLTKNDLIEKIGVIGFSKDKSAKTIEILLEIIKSSLAAGDDVLISGFGKFCVNEKNSRRGRNPATGEEMSLPERKVVTFKCSGMLRDRVENKPTKIKKKKKPR